MTETGGRPRQTRNTERTRRAVLDAAARLMGEQGTAVSLADVAAEAGVSKSGLLHHFPTREQLVLDVVLDANTRFRAFVQEHLDPAEDAPGRMVRAYIRALCANDREFSAFFGSSPLWNGLHRFPGVHETLQDDLEWWGQRFREDGLSEEMIQVVRRAAEGIAAAASYGDETPERMMWMQGILVAMTTGTYPRRER